MGTEHDFLHAFECECQECLDKWEALNKPLVVVPDDPIYKCENTYSWCTLCKSFITFSKPLPKIYSQWVQWISINEIDRLPESLNEVLFTDGQEIFKGYRIQSIIDEPDMWHSSGDQTIYEVTHWMSLPKLPMGNILQPYRT